MDKKQENDLTISRIYHGGFLVRVVPYQQGIYAEGIYAATTLDEALAFVKELMTFNDNQKAGSAHSE